MRILAPCFVLAGLLTGIVPAHGQAPVPIGGEIQINTFTTGAQVKPDLARLTGGDFVVIWESNVDDVDTSYGSIQAQRLDAAGKTLGGQFLINAMTSGDQIDPAVAAAPDGSFAVVWNGQGQSDDEVFGRRFEASGQAIGGDFQVNAQTSTAEAYVGIDGRADGSFVVVWGSYGPQEDSYGIYGRLLDSAGAPASGVFRVNTYTTGTQSRPVVFSEPDGAFQVVWESEGAVGDTSYGSVQTRRFTNDAIGIGTDLQVNEVTAGRQEGAAITRLSDGSTFITFRSALHLRGHKLDAAGIPVGNDLVLPQLTSVSETASAGAALSDGSFVVAWESRGSGGTGADDYSIQMRRFTSEGLPLGDQVQVNTFTTARQSGPRVEAQPEGAFFVVWASEGSAGTDDQSTSIQARRFGLDGDGDSVADAVDNCETDNNPTQADQDLDFIGDPCDNCPADANTGQEDADFDAVGDVCDLCTDSDGDGFGDPGFPVNTCPADRCPGFDDALDADGDTVPDGCDLCAGDDATGDGDGDLVCASNDCNDGDPNASVIDACGICGGDGSSCSIFGSGFETGDTTEWSQTS